MSAENNIDKAKPEDESGAKPPVTDEALSGAETPAPTSPTESPEAGESPELPGSAADVPPPSENPESDGTPVSGETSASGETPLTAAELAAQISDVAPPAPTESYIHPVTGREVYVPKPAKDLGPSAFLMTAALLMFVGGALATMMMVARAFDLHGQTLIYFVIATCAGVLGLAGGLLLRTQGDKWWVGAVIGACFGTIAAILVYAQTSHHSWWR